MLEIKASEQKIRVGLRQTQADPFDYFKDKKKNQTITVKVISTDNKGLTAVSYTHLTLPTILLV